MPVKPSAVSEGLPYPGAFPTSAGELCQFWGPGLLPLLKKSTSSRRWKAVQEKCKYVWPLHSTKRTNLNVSDNSFLKCPTISISKQLKELKFSLKVKVKVKSLSRVRLFTAPWTVAHQAPLSMGFSRQEYWSGWPFPFPGDLPNPGIEPGSLTSQGDALTPELPGKLKIQSTPQKGNHP